MSALVVKKSQAIALFEAMGFKTAKKWDLAKLTEKINEIEKGPDEPFDDEDLDALIDELMEAEEAVVLDDEVAEPDDDDEEGEDEDDDDDAEAEDDEDEDEQEADDDDEQEDEKPKKSKKGDKVKKDKKEKKEKKDKKEKVKGEKKAGGSREKSLDKVTLGILKEGTSTLKQIVKALKKEFPDHDAETLERTTKRRVTGYLQTKYGVKITKNDDGTYKAK